MHFVFANLDTVFHLTWLLLLMLLLVCVLHAGKAQLSSTEMQMPRQCGPSPKEVESGAEEVAS